LLRRCLQKDPGRRLHDIADARIEMQDGMGLPAEAVLVQRRLQLGWLLAACATTLAVGALIGFVIIKYMKSPPVLPFVRSVVKLEPGHWLDGGRFSEDFERPSIPAIAIAHDGSFIIYSAIVEDPGPQAKPQIYSRKVGQLEANPVPGTEGGIHPFLSPDDRWVGFWADGKLMKVSVDGGVPTTLCRTPYLIGASWDPLSGIVYAGSPGGLHRIVAEEGAEPEYLTGSRNLAEEFAHRLPHWLPGGRDFLFTIVRHDFDRHPRVAIFNLKTRQWRIIQEDAADARYLSTGHLVFLRQGILMAVRFDLDTLEPIGKPVSVLTNVMQDLNSKENTSAGHYAVSDSGWLLYVPGGILPNMNNSLVWVGQDKATQPAIPFKAPFFIARLSPDGKQIAYTANDDNGTYIFIYDIARGIPTRLSEIGLSGVCTWTRDSKKLIFAAYTGRWTDLFWQPIDGSSQKEPLVTSAIWKGPGSLHPDDVTLAFWNNDFPAPPTIQLLNLQTRQIKPFLSPQSDISFSCPEFSPDGRWIAYCARELGNNENLPGRWYRAAMVPEWQANFLSLAPPSLGCRCSNRWHHLRKQAATAI
jgi:serine/threonine-protein kinase